MEELIKKWKSILDSTSINKEYWSDICIYLERHSNSSDDNHKKISNSLYILSKISDLSKVKFLNVNICQPYKVSISVSQDQIFELSSTGIDVTTLLENTLLNEHVNKINEIIKEEGGVAIYDVNTEIRFIQDKSTINIISHILPINIERYKKLKKVKKIINEKR